MDYIDRNILELYKIRCIHPATAKDKEITSKLLQFIPKELGQDVFKIYLYGDRAYGYKNSRTHEFAVILDVTRKQIDEIVADKKDALENMLSTDQKSISLAFISACDFEKCKERTTDFDYYVDTYGILLYDSHQTPKIKEGTRHYASAALQNYKRIDYFDKDQRYILLPYLLHIYIAKKGYMFPIQASSQSVVYTMLQYMTVEPQVKEAIKCIQETDDLSLKIQTYNDLETYIFDMKYTTTLKVTEDIDTMHVYEKLMFQKRKEGTLSLSDLTKEQLYIMYVIQKHVPYRIAELYDVPISKIHYRKNKWGILMMQTTVSYMDILDVTNEIHKDDTSLEKIDFLDFPYFAPQAMMLDILRVLGDDKEHLLKEFWKFSDKNIKDEERYIYKLNEITYPRVNIAIDFMKRSGIVINTGYFQYMITQRGKEILEFAKKNQLKEISLTLLEKYFHDFHFVKYMQDIHIDEPLSYEIEILRNAKVDAVIPSSVSSQDVPVMAPPDLNWEELEEIPFSQLPIKVKGSAKKTPVTGRKVNYHKANSQKILNGEKIEEIVYFYEKNRLMQENQPDLAEQVVWVSKEKGDGLGYDIISFKKEDQTYLPIYIEVKGTTKGPEEPFDISEKEVLFSKQNADSYYLYRVGISSAGPVFYQLKGSIEDHFSLTPTSYRANML